MAGPPPHKINIGIKIDMYALLISIHIGDYEWLPIGTGILYV